MRTKLVKRYFCDHCSKGLSQKPAMEKHEVSCIRNPDRVCFLCADKDEDVDIHSMIQAVADGTMGLDELRKATGDCPACILAVIVQFRDGHKDADWIDFDYRAEMSEWNARHAGPPIEF